MLVSVFHTFMSRTELLQRLQSQEPVSSEACFVLLWTYLDISRVAAGENLARSRSLHHFQIEQRLPGGSSLRERVSRAIQELQTEQGDAFDLGCLRLLTALDHAFKDEPLGEDWFPGMDGMEYQVRPRNLFLVDSMVTTERDQSGSRSLYTRLHLAVPRSVEGIDIEIRRFEEWAGSGLRLRLRREKSSFRVMLWPLETVLDYPALDPGKPPSDFVSLDEVRNEKDLRAEVLTALAAARAEQVSLLVFPELAMPLRIQEDIRLTLKGHGPDGHPLLTLVGCCHRPHPEGGDLNEAILLGPDGAGLCCHKKLTSFTTHLGEDRSRIVGERLRVGTTVTVLEGPFGNLAPLICLDFIHMPLRQVLTRTHANVFAVPSLSPSTSAHQDAARALQTTNHASSFVSNRTLGGLTEAATSFFRVPWRNGFQVHLPGKKHSPYLLFSLRQDGQDK
jgi:hypothetical protein